MKGEKMETEEQRIDREFDELNEGIMATQIIEWFEKEHPEPKWTGAEEETTEQFVEEWNIWQRELVLYAAGWKDALKALQEQRYLEWCIKEEKKTTRWFEYVYQFPSEFVRVGPGGDLLWWNLAVELNAVDSWREELGCPTMIE